MATRTDLDLVQDGYELQFAMVYQAFIEAYVAANNNPTEQDAAAARFQAGVRSARAIRDKAKSNLP